ncbi:MAG TPA: cytochrome c [Candidatus Dormibacteraeota bacterium]|nr:cytochrome c [Candidatus Dormibacteraeota bacterium]
MKKSAARINRTILSVVAASFLLAAPAFGQGGASVFKSRCAGCHGADGKGDTGIGKSMHMRSLASSEVQKQSDKELTTIISDGKGAMPAYKDKLSGSEIKGLVSYIREFGKK